MKVGIIGCGQLASMLAESGRELGLETCFAAEPGESIDCVNGLGPVTRMSSEHTGESLYVAMGKPDVITVEREQVNIDLLEDMARFCPVRPEPDTVRQTGNRLLERSLLIDQGLPVAPYVRVQHFENIVEALPAYECPVYIKSCAQGYDGKNQWRLKEEDELESLAADFVEQPCILERGIDFKAEVSIIGVRGLDGEMRFFPLTENHHHRGILLASYTPISDALRTHEQTARNYLATLLEATNYVGVLCAELFVTDIGLVVNELAPRVHNSGHWTMDGCSSSQFEQHMRAITGQSLAPVTATGSAAMVNVLGDEEPVRDFAHSTATRYSYGKSPRPGRKLGHINFTHPDRNHVRPIAEALVKQLYFTDNSRSAARVVNQ